jgi:magnesium-protoporphyrin IX monomethyl ester (oxidative) cyclase
MYDAFGMDPTDYDHKVFRITTDISKQVFPISLDIDNPKFHAGLERLLEISRAVDAAKRQGGVVGGLKRIGLAVAAAVTFGRLYLMPVHRHDLPAQVRMAPAW